MIQIKFSVIAFLAAHRRFLEKLAVILDTEPAKSVRRPPDGVGPPDDPSFKPSRPRLHCGDELENMQREVAQSTCPGTYGQARDHWHGNPRTPGHAQEFAGIGASNFAQSRNTEAV